MTEVGDRTALRDLNDLEQRRLMVKTGQLKGTRYHLNVPHLIEALTDLKRDGEILAECSD